MTRSPDPAMLVDEARRLLGSLGGGAMSVTAYDTAWLARVTAPDGAPAFPEAMAWLLAHQRADGSWGARIPVAQDRLLATLAAVVALCEAGRGGERALAAGVAYLDRALRGDATGVPGAEPGGEVEVVAFELLAPALLESARRLGLALPYDRLDELSRLRSQRIDQLPPGAIYARPNPLIHSLEFLGDALVPELARPRQAGNGSFGASPSATAFVVMRAWNQRAVDYLREVVRVSGGGACNVYPFEVFEKAWVLHGVGAMRGHGLELGDTVAELVAMWSADGVSFTSQGMVSDCDDTALALKVLRQHGHPVDPAVLCPFEGRDYFHCFAGEKNRSISTNVHVADALRECPEFEHRDRMLRKVAGFLRDSRSDGRFWRDKWHISPYYVTGDAVVACAGVDGLDRELAAPAVGWLLETQLGNGGWSDVDRDGTCEETAYALRALSCHAATRRASREAIRRAAAYLMERFDETDYPELWVGKGLYAPRAVVRAAVLGALFCSCQPEVQPC
ncbi:MAG TPA: hypothetical protein VK601_10540 [Kofleriaceae bacterium]|nr:hypothetical protein [Kofleriaceae bacterium]